MIPKHKMTKRKLKQGINLQCFPSLKTITKWNFTENVIEYFKYIFNSTHWNLWTATPTLYDLFYLLLDKYIKVYYPAFLERKILIKTEKLISSFNCLENLPKENSNFMKSFSSKKNAKQEETNERFQKYFLRKIKKKVYKYVTFKIN